MNRVCSECRYWARKDYQPDEGLCRRNAPQVVAIPVYDSADGGARDTDISSIWPTTYEQSWCGQFEAAPEYASSTFK